MFEAVACQNVLVKERLKLYLTCLASCTRSTESPATGLPATRELVVGGEGFHTADSLQYE